MGTISEEMKKIISTWDNEVKENAMPRITYRDKIYKIVMDNPGITARKLLGILQKTDPNQTFSTVTSQLNGLHNTCYVRRSDSISHANGGNNHAYIYYAVPVEEARAKNAQRKRDARIKRAKAIAKAAKMRQAKEEKAQQSSQMSLPFNDVVETAVSVNLSNMTAIQILQQISFAQAKALYAELKGAFGG